MVQLWQVNYRWLLTCVTINVLKAHSTVLPGKVITGVYLPVGPPTLSGLMVQFWQLIINDYLSVWPPNIPMAQFWQVTTSDYLPVWPPSFWRYKLQFRQVTTSDYLPVWPSTFFRCMLQLRQTAYCRRSKECRLESKSTSVVSMLMGDCILPPQLGNDECHLSGPGEHKFEFPWISLFTPLHCAFDYLKAVNNLGIWALLMHYFTLFC